MNMFALQNLESKVAQKADQWKVDTLSQEVNSLKNQVSQLNNRIDNMREVNRRAAAAYQGLHAFFDMLTSGEGGNDDDFVNKIIELKNRHQ